MRRNLRNIEKTINKNYSSIDDYQTKQQAKFDRIYAVANDVYNMLDKLDVYYMNGGLVMYSKLLLKLVNLEYSMIDIYCKIQESDSLRLHYLLNNAR
jgi:hypothetical protein